MTRQGSLLLLSAFLISNALPSMAADHEAKIGDIAPDFTVTTTDNKHISLSSLKGNVVWLNFFATW